MFKRPHRKTLILTCLLLAPGLAETKPDFVPEQAITHCQFIGNVEGSSGYGKNLRWEPIAKSYAERKAEAMGATHLVLTQHRPRGSFNGEIDAKAYACP